MYFDALMRAGLASSGETSRAAELAGFSCLWTNETAHDPFLPLVPAALATRHIQMGTAVAIAFPRSPAVTAYTAWDLAQASGGRFVLGLGTQVKAHIERRFSTEWGQPVERLRDYIAAVRAIWACWQTGERLRYEGPFYSLNLMTPFFSPPPLDEPAHVPPIFIAGVNRRLCKLAGEVCDGFHVHPFHTARYLGENILPWIAEGLSEAKREPSSVQVCASVFAIVGQGAERDRAREDVRKQIAFYASTPSYRTQLEAHGWGDTGEELSRLAGRGQWDTMSALITDEMLAEVAVEGETLQHAAQNAKARYTGIADRIAFYIPFVKGERDDEWAEAAAIYGEK